MMKTYKFRTLINIEPGRDIPSSWIFVIAASKDDAQGLAFDYIKDLNQENKILAKMPNLKRIVNCTIDRIYSGVIFEYMLPWGYISPYAINFDPSIHLN